MFEILPSKPQPPWSLRWERGLPLPSEFTAVMTPSLHQRSPSRMHQWGFGLPAGGRVLSAGSRLWLYTVPFPHWEPWGLSPRRYPHGNGCQCPLCHGGLLPPALLHAGEAVTKLSAGTTWHGDASSLLTMSHVPSAHVHPLLPAPCQLCPWDCHPMQICPRFTPPAS